MPFPDTRWAVMLAGSVSGIVDPWTEMAIEMTVGFKAIGCRGGYDVRRKCEKQN